MSKDAPIKVLATCILIATQAFALTFAMVTTTKAQVGPLQGAISDIEVLHDARVGVAILDVESGAEWLHRGDERFAMASTFKALLSGLVLLQVDRGQLSLDQPVSFSERDIVRYSPVVRLRVGSSITIGELCEATLNVSDNTAANLLLQHLGGPAGFSEMLRRIGDPITRLDRWEPALNEATPYDPRDTTTPFAMTHSLKTLLYGDVLTSSRQEQLAAWMRGNMVSDALLRSVLPDGWTIGDRSGAGGNGTRGIVSYLITDRQRHYIVVIYLTEVSFNLDAQNEVIAEIGRLIFSHLGQAL